MDVLRVQFLKSSAKTLLRPILVAGFASFVSALPDASANVTGSDAQNFNPTTSGLDFVTVQSSETLEPGVFNLGFFANHAENTFPYYDETGGVSRRTVKGNSLTGGDLNIGLGLMSGWDLGFSVPFILSQSVADKENSGYYSSTGMTEVRANTKFRLFGDASGGLALVASGNFNRIQNNPWVGEGGGPIANLELAADASVSHVAVAINAGYRWRNPGKAIRGSGIEPIPDQIIASTALSYLINAIDTKIVFEVLGAMPVKGRLQSATEREYSVLEALAGFKHDSSSGLSIHVGGGTGLVKGVSSPDARVYVGINIAFGSSSKRSAQVDPYYQPPALPQSEPSPAPQVKRTAKRAAITKKKALPKAVEETPPSLKTETISEVKIFDRGSYNHIVINNLEFAAGGLRLKPEAEAYFIRELLPALRELNRRRPLEAIVVEGHTDSLGAESYNLKLSEERAEHVADLLKKSLGLEVSIQSVGLGESSPIADNGNYQGRDLNRRVEFKLLYRRNSR